MVSCEFIQSANISLRAYYIRPYLWIPHQVRNDIIFFFKATVLGGGSLLNEKATDKR